MGYNISHTCGTVLQQKITYLNWQVANQFQICFCGKKEHMNTIKKYRLTAKFKKLSKEEPTNNLTLNSFMRLRVNIYEDLVKTDEMIEVDPSSKTFTSKDFARLYRGLWVHEPPSMKEETKTMLYNLEMEDLIEEV